MSTNETLLGGNVPAHAKRQKRDLVTVLAQYGIYLALVILILFFASQSDVFLSKDNGLNILRQVSVIGICAVGMTFVMLTGGIDLSVGSVIGVSGMVCATLVSLGFPPIVAVAAAMTFGAFAGLLSGFIINVLNIPPLITTLGLMTAFRGISFMIGGGLPVYGVPDSIKFLGQGYIAGIPVPVILMVLAFIAGHIILTHTVFGRQVYGTGGNEEASRLSGVNVKVLKYKIYLIGGVLAAFAGIVLMARVNSGQPKGGQGYELDIITAVVLGGVSIFGGVGRLTGVIAGVLIMGVLANGMILLNIDEYVQWVVKGGVLLAAVALDQFIHGRGKT
ncbi:ABC transporter permease [Pseudoruegeria sp. SK021]|uniref:ABC transporter permease n=1 Tax=Pseudoruegeria sp. SK021 TaxID=1933035 RepID=UPI000A21B5C7|nr:ABC transporter permease [Pseudoruegeria sp. SK021]OSP53446.1 ribose ABC transporter permease [Pseudoruegeria sp. SK021]